MKTSRPELHWKHSLIPSSGHTECQPLCCPAEALIQRSEDCVPPAAPGTPERDVCLSVNWPLTFKTFFFSFKHKHWKMRPFKYLNINFYEACERSDLGESLWISVWLHELQGAALLFGVTPQQLLPLWLHPGALIIQHLLCLTPAFWKTCSEDVEKSEADYAVQKGKAQVCKKNKKKKGKSNNRAQVEKNNDTTKTHTATRGNVSAH